MIQIIKEPEEFYKAFKTYEKCVFCKNSTDTWHEETNNPVCLNCSKRYSTTDL